MKIKFTLILVFISFCSLGCQESLPSSINLNNLSNYIVNSPDIKLDLPPILKEISGLTILNDSTVVCVQDEKGIVFIYDIQSNRILRELEFGGDGDYEDIAKVNDTLYILRSDGTIFEFSNYSSSTSDVRIYETNIPSKDSEGLCYDSQYHRLLIGTKSKIEGNRKGIFSFDLVTKTLIDVPTLIFDTDLLKPNVESKGIIFGGNRKFKFKLSAISINPLDSNLYVLSANEYLIFVFDFKGNLLEVAELDINLHSKAEGIAFFNNGDMLISNEGVNSKPSILRFKPK